MIEIFFNIIKGHHLFNGNKRIAVAILSVLANYLGYKLIYVYEDHVLDVERFAKITSKEKAIPQMITWFKKML